MNPSLHYLKKAFEVLLLRIGGSVLSFMLSMVVSRMFGAEGAGLYFLAFSVMMFCSVLTRLGMDGTLLRFVALHASVEEWSDVRGYFRRIMRLVLVISIGLGGLVALVATPLATGVFNEPDLAGPLLWMGLAVISLNQLRLLTQAFKGLNRVGLAEIVGSLSQPLLALALLYPLAGLFSVQGAAMAFFLATVITAAIGHLLWRHAARTWPTASRPPQTTTLIKSAVPLWMSSTINQAILPWAPVALLGLWAATSEVGIFGVSTRLANLIAVFLVGVNSVLAPQFARLQATERGQDIGPLSRQFALIVTGIALPGFLVLIFAGGQVMSLFGEEFRVGGPVLATLATGQLVACLCGSVRMVLIITGNELGLRNASLVSLGVLIVLSTLLIPTYGAVGAALASAAGTIVTNAMPVILVWRRMGVMAVPGLHFIFRDRPQAEGEK